MSARVRPCKKGCGYPALKGRQFCKWHALMRLSSDEQARAARIRLLDASLLGRPMSSRRATVPKKEWPDGERWCAGCQTFIPLFYCSGSRCKACASMAAHARRIQTNYGIDPAEYERIFAKQGGRCAVCRNRPKTIRFAVDHDHKTGEVRGILCKRCNHDLLGGGHDDVEMLYRAIQYLLFPPAQLGPGRPPRRDQVIGALCVRLDAQERLRAAPLHDPEPAPF